MKVNTHISSRKILLAFAAFAIIIAISALFLHGSISTKLKHLSKLSDSVKLDQFQPNHALLLLRQAEDSFQESFLDQGDKKTAYHITAYKEKLLQAFAEIDSIIQKKADTTELSFEQRTRMWNWYRKKLQLSGKLYIIKHSFDSLLTTDLEAYTKNKALTVNNLIFHVLKISLKDYNDTVRKVKPNKKRAFFGRIKDAIVNKDANNDAVEINHNRISKVVDSVTQKIIVNDKNVYVQKLKQLQQNNKKMMDAQRKLIAINIGVSNALEGIINDAREINYKMEYELKYATFKSYKETALLINKFFMVAIFMILTFAVLLIGFIVKLNQSEAILRMENERSIIMAQQKMDLLLYMSHEVRNPLSAIKGFLHAFSKSDLSPKQKDMLKSIRLSSDMLLHTLTDTLDTAKMESSKFKINNAPFNPDFIFDEVIESLAYGAIKKNLTIDCHFEGDKHVVVLGDALRLKQVLFNLLSNAIKYTRIGGITIKARLLAIKGNYILYVDITDTGEGISPEQQANLFSKYHQTNSAGGKIGTGLGLYLCKVLIEIQEGKISVTSEIEKGSTFSFYIPYE
ncbi:sensor histidine kinase [Mucilaginibacter sp. OK098]|uniref:sensor histidine kinase n=1 Tax=Mucilaginibacter sp. OK098 TaxID=1855297 RepID=UPI000919510A|nr:HAMP domain-containing sensor histidine kinase [Mucilaginibacter sp. OK098]SHN14198.1 His Kinase A (phospho-acceptor) domain-containing protein [Mucilaginibacter sp. OK098]